MERTKRETQLLGRRRALQIFGASIGAAGGLLALQGCKDKGGGESGSSGSTGTSSGAATTGANSCNSPVDEASAKTRKTLGYKKQTDTPEKKCSGCAQYEAGKYGDCGACKLFGGPVNPNGVCLSFAPLAGGAGSAAPAKSG